MKESTPTDQFVINADETISDKKTGLVWKRCSEGQSTTTSACDTNSPSRMTWQDALLYVETFNADGGFADSNQWRLPNVKELVSIVERACYQPAINSVVFPNLPIGADARYWSSTTSVSSPAEAWYLSSDTGIDFYRGKVSFTYHIRLVRDPD